MSSTTRAGARHFDPSNHLAVYDGAVMAGYRRPGPALPLIQHRRRAARRLQHIARCDARGTDNPNSSSAAAGRTTDLVPEAGDPQRS